MTLGSIATGSVVGLVTNICERDHCPVEDISIFTGVTLVAKAGAIDMSTNINAKRRMPIIPSSSKVQDPAIRVTGRARCRYYWTGVNDEPDGFAISARH